MGQGLLIHANSRIADPHGNVVSTLHSGPASRLLPYCHILRLYSEPAAFGHGILGVDYQIGQHLGNLTGISTDRP